MTSTSIVWSISIEIWIDRNKPKLHKVAVCALKNLILGKIKWENNWKFLNWVKLRCVEQSESMYSLGRGVQLAYGSPSWPSKHEQIGWWFCVVQRALNPHAPRHGSWQRCPMHARFDGHSWWMIHSGRQFGGAPSIPMAHEQTARWSSSRHSELAPHGLGIHGWAFFEGPIATRTRNKKKTILGLCFWH